MSAPIEADYDARRPRAGLTTTAQASGEACVICGAESPAMVPAGWVTDNAVCETQAFRCSSDCTPRPRDPALSDPERHFPYAAGMLEERLRSLLDALDKVDATTDDYWRERAVQQLASERALSRNAIRRVHDGAKAMRGGR